MNEADRKAMDIWSKETGVRLTHIAVRSWNAACEHKQRKIDALKAQIDELERELETAWDQSDGG